MNEQTVTTRSIPDAILDLSSRVRWLEATVNQLQPCPEIATAALEAIEAQPVIRVRLQHTHTLKDGWRLSETTVEYTGPAVDHELIARELATAHAMGAMEASKRNANEEPVS